MGRSTRIAVAVAATGGVALFVVDLVATSRLGGPGYLRVLGSIASSSYLIAGLITWTRRPANRTGLLMVAAGYVGFLQSIWSLHLPILITLGFWVQGLDAVLRGHILLAYPSGRLPSRPIRSFVILLYVFVLGYGVTVKLAAQTPASFGCFDCPAGVITLFHSASSFEVNGRIFDALSVVLSVCVSAILIERWWTGTPAYRTVIGPVLLVGAIPQSIISTVALTSWFDIPIDVRLDLIGAYYVSIALVAFVILFGMLRTRMRRGTVGNLVVRLGSSSVTTSLREPLAQTLRDPSLEVAYYLPDVGSFVDEDGRPVLLPDRDSGRAVTVLEQDGDPLAALIHDPALLEEPELVEAASAATRLALENERLRAEVMAQLETVRASRARIVETADAERRRLERDLHDGAQQRLLMLAMTLRTMRAQASSPDADGALVTSIDRADRELASAMSELRELASGIHPIVLTRAGIGPALASLAELSTMPVTIDEVPAERLPPSVESTTFFVVSEALANAGKHARASHATVRVRRSNGDVIVEVADNGVGGASPGGGSGLVGLSDRVAAIGGSLEVMTPASGGTRLVARFPCPAPALVPQGGA